jgi:hypothetical protein
MEPKISKERFFSAELQSKSDLKSVTIHDGTRENVLVEGSIGELVHIVFTEGIILEIAGKKGVLRIDITEEEIAQRKTSSTLTETSEGGE